MMLAPAADQALYDNFQSYHDFADYANQLAQHPIDTMSAPAIPWKQRAIDAAKKDWSRRHPLRMPPAPAPVTPPAPAGQPSPVKLPPTTPQPRNQEQTPQTQGSGAGAPPPGGPNVGGPSTQPGREPPNPWGQNGKEDHKSTVDRLRRKAQEEFPNDIIHENESIKNQTGVNRRPDVWVEDGENPGVVKKVYEAARQNQDGTWVSREGAKEIEYRNAGIDYHFEPVK